MTETYESIQEKIEKAFPSPRVKNQMLCTLLGSSALMADFIVNKMHFNDIPTDVQYCILMTCYNMMNIMGGETEFQCVDLSDDKDLYFGEQQTEHIYRKMKNLVEIIIKNFKENEVDL